MKFWSENRVGVFILENNTFIVFLNTFTENTLERRANDVGNDSQKYKKMWIPVHKVYL